MTAVPLDRQIAGLREVLEAERLRLGVLERRRPSSTAGPRGGVAELAAARERQRARVERVEKKIAELEVELGTSTADERSERSTS